MSRDLVYCILGIRLLIALPFTKSDNYYVHRVETICPIRAVVSVSYSVCTELTVVYVPSQYLAAPAAPAA